MAVHLTLSRGACVLKEVTMDPNGFCSVDLGRLDAILKRKLGQRDMHIPRVAATLTPMPPTVQCMAGAMMLRNPHQKMDLVVAMPDGTRMSLGPDQETPIPSGARLWNDVTLTYTVPFVTIFSCPTDDENMTDDDDDAEDDDREEAQPRDDNWLHADAQASSEEV